MLLTQAETHKNTALTVAYIIHRPRAYIHKCLHTSRVNTQDVQRQQKLNDKSVSTTDNATSAPTIWIQNYILQAARQNNSVG